MTVDLLEGTRAGQAQADGKHGLSGWPRDKHKAEQAQNANRNMKQVKDIRTTTSICIPPITQGASPQGSLFSRTVASQQSAAPRPRLSATVEQPAPPHWPHSKTQQAPLDSMPLTPLLHVSVNDGVDESAGGNQGWGAVTFRWRSLTPNGKENYSRTVDERADQETTKQAVSSPSEHESLAADCKRTTSTTCCLAGKRTPQAHLRRWGACQACPWLGRTLVPLGRGLDRNKTPRHEVHHEDKRDAVAADERVAEGVRREVAKCITATQGGDTHLSAQLA